MKKWEEKIQELELEVEELQQRNSAIYASSRQEVEDAKNLAGGLGVGGFILGLIAFYIGSSFIGGQPSKSKYINREIDAQPLSTVIEQSTNENLVMLGTMKCTDHDPTHAAATHDERKELAKKHGCAAWSFTGRLTNDLRGLHAFETEKWTTKRKKKPNEKTAWPLGSTGVDR